MRRLESHDWWEQLVSQKDQLSLRELAAKYDVTPGAISAALKRQGITRQPAPPGPRTSRARRAGDDLPPEMGGGRVAFRPERSATGGRPGSKDDLILSNIDIVGTKPDRDIAESIGVSVRTLASFRSRHKIPAYKGPRTQRKPGGRRSKIDPYKDMLGKVHDRVVAEKAGVTLNAVRNYRVKHGIAAASGPGRPKGSTNRKRERPPVSTGKSAFMVRFDGGAQRVVLADDLASAIDRASAADLGRTLGAEYLAEAI